VTDPIRIGGPTGSLTFARGETAGSPADRVTWMLELPGLRVIDEVWLADWDGGAGLLAKFFADIASSWRGWDGAKEWARGSGEVRLAASHDGIGHVVLRVTMRAHWNGSRPYPDEWTVSGALALEPGSLDETARRMSDLLGVNQVKPA
jgi:hypothetical protein